MDKYATHLNLLQKIFEFKKISSVIEFGMGNNSTSFFINKVEKLISIEMQDEQWYNFIYEKYKNEKNWEPILCLGAKNFFKLKYSNVDLIFVDGHGESRPDCVNYMSQFSENIVIHDTEAIKIYNLQNVNLPKDYYCFVDRSLEPWTTLYSKDITLINYLRDNIQSPDFYKCYCNGQEIN